MATMDWSKARKYSGYEDVRKDERLFKKQKKMKNDTIKHSIPKLTLFADASVYHKHGIAAWGGWAKGDGKDSILLSGEAPFNKDTTVVELWALAKLVQQLVWDRYLHPDCKSIILQSDNLKALSLIHGNLKNSWPAKRKDPKDARIKPIKKLKGAEQEPMRILRGCLGLRDVVYLRHIKSHQEGVHGRSWVNEQCDQAAKQKAREIIAQKEVSNDSAPLTEAISSII